MLGKKVSIFFYLLVEKWVNFDNKKLFHFKDLGKDLEISSKGLINSLAFSVYLE